MKITNIFSLLKKPTKKNTAVIPVALLNTKSPFAFREAYNVLRSNLEFISLGGEVKVIALTSALPDEGKSVTAINLAINLSEAGKRVCLIDADMRKPSVHRYLNLRGTTTGGLSTYLSGAATAESVIGRARGYNFHVMLAGKIPPNPSELLSHERFNQLTTDLKELFDYIIIDTPPVGAVTDATIVGRLGADGVILVVRQKFANEEVILKAKNRLVESGANLLGVILNGYDASHNVNATDQDYYYYYRETSE